MTKFRLLAAAALIVSAAPLTAQHTATFSTARLSQHVQTLGSDAFEGRGPATAGETKTLAYLTDQFAKAGLQPGGDLVMERVVNDAHSQPCTRSSARLADNYA